jgi:hypothetical protein
MRLPSTCVSCKLEDKPSIVGTRVAGWLQAYSTRVDTCHICTGGAPCDIRTGTYEAKRTMAPEPPAAAAAVGRSVEAVLSSAIAKLIQRVRYAQDPDG